MRANLMTFPEYTLHDSRVTEKAPFELTIEEKGRSRTVCTKEFQEIGSEDERSIVKGQSDRTRDDTSVQDGSEGHRGVSLFDGHIQRRCPGFPFDGRIQRRCPGFAEKA
jgi:hypothetical protein